MKRTTVSLRKGATRNSYEFKDNVIEDSKGKASTFKGLKRKKIAWGTKERTKKTRISALRELATSAIKRDTRRTNVVVIPKRTKRTIHRQT